MSGDSGENNTEQQQRLYDLYKRGHLWVLMEAMTLTQQQQFCRAVVEQVQTECTRVLALIERRYSDPCVAQAIAQAQAFLAHGTPPSDCLARRFEDFYNPFWLSYTDRSTDVHDCGTAAAYCTEQTVSAAHRGNWHLASEQAITVVDMVAQAAKGDYEAARGDAKTWQVEVAWALLQGVAPPRWQIQPPLS